jgi:hypothetical protein
MLWDTISCAAPTQLHSLSLALCVTTWVPVLQVPSEAKRALEASFDQLRARLLPPSSNSNLPY